MCAITTSFLSVAKTAAEGQAMWLLQKVASISHWIPLLPYFLLTTTTRCLTLVVFISYLHFLSILPILQLFVTGILTGYWAGKQRGMSCFNCGPSALLSSAFFTTLKESSSSSSRFYLWNTLISFLVCSTWISVLCILITLQVDLVHLVPGQLPIFSCYMPSQLFNLTLPCTREETTTQRYAKLTLDQR